MLCFKTSVVNCDLWNDFHNLNHFLLDDKPPVKVFCPQDMYYQVKSHDEVMVRWPEPIFKDNVQVVRTRSNFKNGQLHKPTSFNVVYDAYDALNNYATCEFRVHIECRSFLIYDKSISNPSDETRYLI